MNVPRPEKKLSGEIVSVRIFALLDSSESNHKTPIH